MKLRTLLFGGMLAALSAVTAAPAAAQFSPADSAALVGFRLSAENVAQFRQSVQNLSALDSATLESMDDIGQSMGGGSFMDVAAAFDANPAVKGAIESAGLTSRDWVLFLISMVFATTVQTMEESGMQEAVAELKKYVPQENITFYREHTADFQAIMQQLEAMSPSEGDEGHEGGHDHNH